MSTKWSVPEIRYKTYNLFLSIVSLQRCLVAILEELDDPDHREACPVVSALLRCTDRRPLLLWRGVISLHVELGPPPGLPAHHPRPRAAPGVASLTRSRLAAPHISLRNSSKSSSTFLWSCPLILPTRPRSLPVSPSSLASFAVLRSFH